MADESANTIASLGSHLMCVTYDGRNAAVPYDDDPKFKIKSYASNVFVPREKCSHTYVRDPSRNNVHPHLDVCVRCNYTRKENHDHEAAMRKRPWQLDQPSAVLARELMRRRAIYVYTNALFNSDTPGWDATQVIVEFLDELRGYKL